MSVRLFVLLLIFLQGCIHFVKEPENERLFKADREVIWESLVKVLKPYPLVQIDEEKGLIKTNLIRVGKVWSPPGEKPKAQLKYNLSAHLYKQESHFRLVILKRLQKQRDFFSKVVTIPSDFLEEEEILYRVDREIKIKKLIQKLKQ